MPGIVDPLKVCPMVNSKTGDYMGNFKMSFNTWLASVDHWTRSICGMSTEDLFDWDYWNAYESNVSPKVAAKRAIKACRNF